jgi:AraC-like DNA-binding protein
MEETRLQPGQEWLEPAGVWRFLRVDNGAAYWLGKPNTRSVTEGELLIIPPAAQGVVRASQLNEVSLHVFSFAPDGLWGLFSLEERHNFERGNRPGQLWFLPSTHPATRRFAALAAACEVNPGLSQRAEALGIVAEVFDHEIAPCHPPPSAGLSARQRFQQMVAQMPDTEVINHTAAQLARLCGCSSRHFNRLFRKQFGISVRSKQAELRLLKARQLLCCTKERIAQIAEASGYRNLSLFNFLFKKRFGKTPTEWRKQAALQNALPSLTGNSAASGLNSMGTASHSLPGAPMG